MEEPASSSTHRLVSFLGTGRYEETTYCFEGRTFTTRYVAHALASLTKPEETVILATDEAWGMHGESLLRMLEEVGTRRPEHRLLPLGQNPDELWQQFRVVVDSVICGPDISTVLFDITHGFRSQPFLAGAALDFVRSVQSVDTRLRVVYGAFEARNDNQTPIWDLTVFSELLDWSRSLLLFLRTGRAGEVAAPTERLGRELNKQWFAQGRQGPQPQLRRFGEALRRFGGALETVRTGDLLCHTPQTSAASELLGAIDGVEAEAARYLPPLAQVLSLIRGLVAPLVTRDRLSEPGGQAALRALAALYLQMGRYSEAASTLREADITRFASPKADCPGSPDFSSDQRELAEKAWYQADPKRVQTIADLRNDIDHAGYRRRPLPAQTIRTMIEQLIEAMSKQSQCQDP